MSVAANLNPITFHTGDGVSKEFVIGWEFTSDILVYVNEVAVSFVLSADDLQVVLDVVPALGSVVVILRDTDIAQPINFADLQKFPGGSIEAAVDLLTQIAQEHRRDLGRTLQAPPGQLPFGLPYGEDATGKVLVGVGSTKFVLVDAHSVMMFTGKVGAVENVGLIALIDDPDVLSVQALGHVQAGDGLGGYFISDGTSGHTLSSDDGENSIVVGGKLFVRQVIRKTRSVGYSGAIARLTTQIFMLGKRIKALADRQPFQKNIVLEKDLTTAYLPVVAYKFTAITASASLTGNVTFFNNSGAAITADAYIDIVDLSNGVPVTQSVASGASAVLKPTYSPALIIGNEYLARLLARSHQGGDVTAFGFFDVVPT